MREFKVGDQVMMVGVVVDVDHDDEVYPYYVEFGGDARWLPAAALSPAPPAPTGKTVRVRVPVAVTDGSGWFTPAVSDTWPDAEKQDEALDYASQWSGITHVVFIEADVPIPETPTVQGTVTDG